MSHQTVQHHDVSLNDEKLRLISGSEPPLSWKAMMAPSVTMSLRKWLSGILRITFISVLAIYGCTSEYSGQQSHHRSLQGSGKKA